LAIETSTPEVLTTCLACGAVCAGERPCGGCGCEPAGATASTSAPVALAPSVDRWTAARLFRSSAWPLALRHRALASALEPSELRPVFVPAWSLDLRVQSTWTCGAERSGTRSQSFEGLVVPGVEGVAAGVVSAALAGRTPPSEMPAADLSEWSPLGVTRPVAAAWSAACAHLCEAAAEEAALGLSLEEIDRLSVETRFEEGAARPLLVPAWRARLRVENRDVSVLLDACNGRVVGPLPWNGVRLAAVAAGAGALLGALWVLFL